MRCVYSFNEAYSGIRDVLNNDGRVFNLDLSSQTDIPHETTSSEPATAGSDDSLFSLCNEVTGLLGVLSTSATMLNERYHSMVEDEKYKKTGRTTYVPYKDDSDELDYARAGEASAEDGEEVGTFSIDYKNLIDSFRQDLTINGTDRRLYDELIEKSHKLRQKIIDEYKKVQEMLDSGALGSSDKTIIKRRVAPMDPIHAAQMVLLSSELAQPFYFGKNAFTPVNPLDYVNKILVKDAVLNGLEIRFQNALEASAKKDQKYLSKIAR